MSDAQVDENVQAEDTNAAATEAKAEKAPRPDPTKPCYCSAFEVFDPENDDSVFNTGCDSTTKRQFAQGHDARLVSFLVDGYFDNYSLRRVVDGVSTTYATPELAAVTASEALGAKAKAATANRQAKDDAKKAKADEREQAKAKKAEEKKAADAKKAADKEKAAADKAAAAEAKKAEKANTPQAEVVAGSVEGDRTPLQEGEAKIKVGRWEYVAVIDAEGFATFTDGKGEEQRIERDGYRVLQDA